MRILLICAMLTAAAAGALLAPPAASAQQASASFQLFYDELSPYGEWAEHPDYGYVWIPDVDQDFSPYGTNGHWVYTDDGWAWYSDYPWGWAPFHYGRWGYDDYYGWFWVPRNEWGPAWVTWRRRQGYYGWAPLSPGITIEVSFGGGYSEPDNRWIFVRDRDFGRPDIDRHYIDRSTNVAIINNTTVINNTYVDNSRHVTYVAGPARDDVQKVTGTAIRPVAIRESARPGQTLGTDQLQIYRPLVQASDNNGRKPVPSKLVNLKEVKPVAQRKAGIQQRTVSPPATGNPQPQQPLQTPPAMKKAAGQRPRTANPQQPNVAPATGNRSVKRPQTAIAPSADRPSQPQSANPPSSTGRVKQPKIAAPRAAPPEQRQIGNPPGASARVKQPQTAAPVDNGQPPQLQHGKPSDKNGNAEKPQGDTLSTEKPKAQPSSSKAKQRRAMGEQGK